MPHEELVSNLLRVRILVDFLAVLSLLNFRKDSSDSDCHCDIREHQEENNARNSKVIAVLV